jgi:Uncharacterized protein conserved in bacteria
MLRSPFNPDVKGLPKLNQAINEYNRIRGVVPDKFMLNIDGTRPNPNDTTTAKKKRTAKIQDVLDRLQDTSIVHLACHGEVDPLRPLDSALLLHDGRLTISRMQSIRRTSPGSLVFLSACMTAKCDETQPDEVIHLAATMLSVGFRSAVATMWYVLVIMTVTSMRLIERQGNG